MNTLTGAQRYNNRLNKIFDDYNKQLITENGIMLPREIIDSVKNHAHYLKCYRDCCADEKTGNKTYTGTHTKEGLWKELKDHENALMWKMHRYLKTVS